MPLKYHVLKAEFIVRLSRAATVEPKSVSKRKVAERAEIRGATVTSQPEVAAPVKAPAPKRGGHERVVFGRERKKKQAAEINLGEPRGDIFEDNRSNTATKKFGEVEDFNLSETEPVDPDAHASGSESDDDNGGYGANVEEEKMEEAANDADFINWQFNFPPVPLDKPFIGAAGPKHGLSPETALPIDYFNLFLPMFFWVRVAKYTNSKAEMTRENNDGKTRDWTRTCGAEVKAFIASVIWWCICKSLSFEQFYKNHIDPTRVKRWFPSWLRWSQIKRFLKVSDPSEDEKNKQDSMFKVREVFEYFINACRTSYWPDRNIALDEAVKKFKGRCVFKQYIKNKPVKWGIKIFCVCCSATSYLCNAMFYVGKAQDNYQDSNESVTHTTVKKLLEPFAGKNHHVFMDNYYTGIPLFKDLQNMDIYSTGTIRTNRKGLDQRVTMKKSEETQLKKNPGTTRFSSCGNFVYAAWFDKRPVHMLTNCHVPIGDDTVEHWFPARRGEVAQTPSGKVLKHISICPIVKCYRKWMGGVDRFDQYRAYIRLEMRTNKFWHVMFWFIVESALVNAFVLYKVTRELAFLEVEYTNLEFRVAVILALVSEWESMGCSFSPDATVSSPSTQLKVKQAKKVRQTFGRNISARYSSFDLHMSNLEDIPVLEGAKCTRRQLRCVYSGCEKSRTTKWCRECAAPLCFPGCYTAFHTPK